MPVPEPTSPVPDASARSPYISKSNQSLDIPYNTPTKPSTEAFDKALGEDSLETRRNKHPLEAYKPVTRYTLQQVISESPTTVGTYTHYVQSTLPDFPTNERGLRVLRRLQSRTQAIDSWKATATVPGGKQIGLRCRGSVGIQQLSPVMLGMNYK